VGTPSRSPASIRACITQRRSVSVDTLNRVATAVMQAHSEAYSSTWSTTSRTALALNFSSYFFGMM
jgi:hypothetical protein